MNLKALFEQKGRIVASMRGLLEKATAESRDLNTEESASYAKMEAELASVDTNIKRVEALNAADATIRDARIPAQNIARGATAGDRRFTLSAAAQKLTERLAGSRLAFMADDGYMAAFEDYARRNQPSAALQVGTNSEGGYVVPVIYETVLIEALAKQSAMRQICSVITSASDRNIPLESSYGAAAWVDEEAVYPESDSAFGRSTSSAYKLGRIMKVSEELLQDAFFDLPGYISRAYAKSFGDAEETAFVAGDGTKKPTGLATTSTKAFDSTSKTAVVADEVIDLFYAVKPDYRRNGRWLINDTSAKLIRKLKDTTNQYIWQPGLQAGQPDMLLGRPVEFSDAVDSIGALKQIIFFGDFSYYQIVDRAGVAMQRLNELYAANGQVGFKMHKRTDGHLLVADAIKHIKCAA